MPILDPVKKAIAQQHQLVHEKLQRLRFTQRSNRAEMQKVQGQEPALEEARNSKVTIYFHLLYFIRLST